MVKLQQAQLNPPTEPSPTKSFQDTATKLHAEAAALLEGELAKSCSEAFTLSDSGSDILVKPIGQHKGQVIAPQNTQKQLLVPTPVEQLEACVDDQIQGQNQNSPLLQKSETKQPPAVVVDQVETEAEHSKSGKPKRGQVARTGSISLKSPKKTRP